MKKSSITIPLNQSFEREIRYFQQEKKQEKYPSHIIEKIYQDLGSQKQFWRPQTKFEYGYDHHSQTQQPSTFLSRQLTGQNERGVMRGALKDRVVVSSRNLLQPRENDQFN